MGRNGVQALAIGLMLASGAAWAQTPSTLSFHPNEASLLSSATSEDVPVGAMEQRDDQGGAVIPVKHCTSCQFDAQGHWHEFKHKKIVANLGSRLRAGWSHRKDDEGDPDNSYCDFECANCYGWIDVEKRIFFTYSYDSPNGTPTKFGYGSGNSAQVGVEVLPWVLRDSPNIYTRWGGTALFNYTGWDGFDGGYLQSNLSGRVLSVSYGTSYGFGVGPTWRTDFEIFGVRLSPNATVALFFDWTTMKPKEPILPNVRTIDEFRFAGFDVGGIIRAGLDIPITKSFNFVVLGQWKFVPTDVMTRNGDLRSHIGVVVGFNQEF